MSVQATESFELRRQRLGMVVRELAADLVEERRRRLVLEREVRELRTRLAAYETSESGAQSSTTRSSSDVMRRVQLMPRRTPADRALRAGLDTPPPG